MGARKYLTFGEGASLLEGSLRPVVRVVGVGGAGCNIVDSMLDLSLRHVDVLAVNTDAQNLVGLRCRKVLIGKDVTRGRGASSIPAMGEEAARADIGKLEAALSGTEVLFLICGLGGGTGTGASPVIARLGRKLGALVVALTVQPFKMEGSVRNRVARQGLERLRNTADAVVTVENDRLVRDYPQMGFRDALKVADHLLVAPVASITQLLTRGDLPNLRRVLGMNDLAHLGFGEAKLGLGASGAVKDALGSLMPAADTRSHDRAVAVIHCPPGRGDDELHSYVQELHHCIHDSAQIMWGPIVDPSLEDEVRIMAIVGRARPGEAGGGGPEEEGGEAEDRSGRPPGGGEDRPLPSGT